MPAPQKLLDDLALSDSEYKAIVQRLGREPNELELGLFGSLWSEHCAYKHSKPLLKSFRAESPKLLVSAGEENAGVIDIGGGQAIVMKVESHNHPSAVEPYQGAATGVGGIVRDIFAMGARPIALLNSLRFGIPDKDRNRQLFKGVVGGISGYGNCIGIPDVGGEIFFSDSYSGNPIVNAMCVGIVNSDMIVKAKTGAPGNIVLLVGAETGRDGIHGASGLASRSFDENRELRTAVQVGNPFLEKVLIESCLEVADLGVIAGMQDLGAAGLTSACVEAASKSGYGVEIDVSRVPRRETGMTPYEVMLSESQERMLIFVSTDHVSRVNSVFDRWGLKSTIIGKITEDRKARVVDGDELQGEVEVDLLTDPPLYRLQGVKPSGLNTIQEYDLDRLTTPSELPETILLRLLSAPNIASKEWVYRQYDHQVQTNTVSGPGSGAAILRIKGTSKGIALSIDGNGRYCHIDPYIGGMIAVAEACRNISIAGAEPIALTDCLNFGNPEHLDVYYQLEQCINGLRVASEALNAPIVSGNVSLYNESQGEPIYPTPVIGALGLMEDVTKSATSGFKNVGDLVVLLGSGQINEDTSGLSGSEFLETVHGLVCGIPSIDLPLEIALQKTCRRAVREQVVLGSHDCSEGGLAITLAECCIIGGKGFESSLPAFDRWDTALFGEYQSRVVVSLNPRRMRDLERICYEENVPWCLLGQVTECTFKFHGLLDTLVSYLADAWNHGLERRLCATQS